MFSKHLDENDTQEFSNAFKLASIFFYFFCKYLAVLRETPIRTPQNFFIAEV